MDVNTRAFDVLQQAIGEKKRKKKTPDMSKRGLRRAEVLTPERRKEIAEKAAAIRWKSQNGKGQ